MAMIVPVGNRRLEAGRMVRKANAMKKNRALFRRKRIAAIATAATEIHRAQSSALPRANGICGQE